MSNFAYFALNSGVGYDQPYVAFSSDAWLKALEVAILGMLMIFAVLSLLWGVLAIFKLVFAGKTPKEKKPAKTESVSAPTVTEVKTEMPVPTAAVGGDEELIAVLTAAIAAYRASEGMSGADINGFRVVSFKRSGAGRAWNSKK